jgi:hypothetical protein
MQSSSGNPSTIGRRDIPRILRAAGVTGGPEDAYSDPEGMASLNLS